MSILKYLDDLSLEYAQACKRIKSGEIYYIPSGKQCRLGIPVYKKSGSEGKKSRTNRRNPKLIHPKGKRKTTQNSNKKANLVLNPFIGTYLEFLYLTVSSMKYLVLLRRKTKNFQKN